MVFSTSELLHKPGLQDPGTLHSRECSSSKTQTPPIGLQIGPKIVFRIRPKIGIEMGH